MAPTQSGSGRARKAALMPTEKTAVAATPERRVRWTIHRRG